MESYGTDNSNLKIKERRNEQSGSPMTACSPQSQLPFPSSVKNQKPSTAMDYESTALGRFNGQVVNGRRTIFSQTRYTGKKEFGVYDKERARKEMKKSNIYLQGNFQVQFFAAKIQEEDDISWVITETARFAPDTSKYINQRNSLLFDGSADQNQNCDRYQEAIPYATVLGGGNLSELEDQPQLIEIYDKGSDEKLLQLIHYFGLKNVCVTANVFILIPSTEQQHTTTTLEAQHSLNLDFFRERARDFLMDSCIKQQDIYQFGGTLSGAFSPIANAAATMRTPSRVGTQYTQRRSLLNNKGYHLGETFSNSLFNTKINRVGDSTKQVSSIKHWKTPSNFTQASKASKFFMKPRPNEGQQHLISPSDYIEQHVLQDTSPETIKNRFSQTPIQGFKPLLRLNKVERGEYVKTHPDSILIAHLRGTFQLNEQQFTQAVTDYQKALREISKPVLLELKFLKSSFASQKVLLFRLLELLTKLIQNSAGQITKVPQEYLQMLIMDETLKKQMLSVDPFQRLSLPTALNVLEEIRALNISLSSSYLQSIRSLHNFIESSCLITIGSRVFDFNHKFKSDKNHQSLLEGEDEEHLSRSIQPFSNGSSLQIKKVKKYAHQQVSQKDPYKQKRSKTSTAIAQGQGNFLQPKHLFFSHEHQSLRVAPFIPPAVPVFNIHETLPKTVLRDHFDEVELPDIDLYNYNDVSLAKYVPKTSPILKRDPIKAEPKVFPFTEIQDKIKDLPISNDGIMQYAKSHNPDELPTAVLLKLAELMKNRRVDLYEHNDVNQVVNQRMFNMR